MLRNRHVAQGVLAMVVSWRVSLRQGRTNGFLISAVKFQYITVIFHRLTGGNTRECSELCGV